MMWRYSIIAGFLCAVICGCSPQPVGNASVQKPLKPVDLALYSGRWFEIARYDNSFEKDCYAVTAEYMQRTDGLVGIINRCHENSVSGNIRQSVGKAKIVSNTDNAELAVSFFGPFYVGDYWILDHANDYSWSVVGEPSGKYLWILARSPRLSDAQKAFLWKRAHDLGYDTTLLKLTPQ